MTESKLRQKFVDLAAGYLGCKAGSEAHRAIVDRYNSHTPRARGYKLKYTDAWCAGFVGGVAVQAGLTELIPMEVSVPKMTELAKDAGIWVEQDGYTPKKGDLIVFYWNDTGEGDATGGANHVGIVQKVSGGTVTTVEGNFDKAVGSRRIAVDGKFIRGFITPDYAGYVKSHTDGSIQYCVGRGLLAGDDPDPDRPVTLGELAAALERLDKAHS